MPASNEVYSTTQPHTTAGSERPSTALDRRRIDALKAGVRIEQVAGAYGEFKLLGNGRLLGRCISPEHEDKTPSMSVFTDTQRFKCFGIGCAAQGDVIDFVQLAEGCELWVAMEILADRYGLDLPGRSGSWYAKQRRQERARREIEAAKIRRVQRRLYRWILAPALVNIADEAERREEAEHAWADAGRVARLLVCQLRGEEAA